MNRALKEALRTVPPDAGDEEGAARYVESFGIESVDNAKWLTMPRKYTRSSVRFSLPVNSNDLARLTPFEYLSKHVWISDHRKQLYRFVFNKYNVSALDNDASTDDSDGDQSDAMREAASAAAWRDCRMMSGDVDEALIDVIGYKSKHNEPFNDTAHIRQVLDLDKLEQSFLTFRSWCGIVAFAERYLNTSPLELDQCDEVRATELGSRCHW